MDTKRSLWASAAASVGASLCCVGPLVFVSLGMGGAWLATLTQLEPVRPLFIVMALGLLVSAGIKLYRRPVACVPGTPCADDAVVRRQRLLFWLVALPLLGLLGFPWYASLFY